MAEQSPFTNLSVVLSRTSQNFAPSRPILETIQNKKLPKTQTKFEQSFREWYTGKLNYQRKTWEELYSMAQLVALFRQGNQLLVRRPFGQVGYYVRPIQNDDTYRQTAMNLMTFHSQISESKLMAVNPTVNMRPGDDTPEAIASAQAARPVVDYFETQWYTAKFTRREAIRLLTDGIFIHQVRQNPFKGTLVPTRQVGTIDQQVDPGEGSCADCDFEGAAEDFEPNDFGYTCPQCQSEATDVRPPETQTLSQISMGAPQPTGEPEIISSSLASWRWNLAVDLEKSSWAIKRQYVTPGTIKLALGDVVIPASASSDDYGLDILHALTYSGQAFQGTSYTAQYGRDQSKERPTMFEAWLSPEDQAEIECDEGETICGVTMPKGRISNFFQGQPICVVGFNDGALILATYAGESQQQEVVTCQWYMDAESGAGRGMEDTAAVQRRFNAVDGQIYQGLATTATPPVFVDLRMLREDSGNYLFKPGVNHNVNLSMLPVGMRMQDAIYLPQPGQVSQQFMAYGTEFLGKNMANLSSLAVEFSDLLSIDNRTATGAQISAALANSLYGPMLMSKAESRVEIAKKIVALQAKFGVVSRFFPGKGDARGREVDAKSLKGKVIFELQENSHLPVTPYSQISDVTALLQAFGGNPLLLTQLKQTDPELFRAITKPFAGLNLGIDKDDEISTLCLTRLEQIKENFEAGVDDPNMLVQMIMPPVSKVEPKHQDKAEWYSNYLDQDNAQKLPMPVREAIENMYWLHINMETQKQLPQAVNQGIVGAAAAAPAAIGAAALQGQETPEQDTTGHEAEQAAQDRELEAHSQLAEQENAKELKAMEIQGQIAVTREQGKNAIETTKIAGENALKVQRAKPTPKKTKAA
jgi:hypothetical protein